MADVDLIDLGDPWPDLGVETFNTDGDPANATLVQLTITAPDGTAAVDEETVTSSSTGVYEYAFIPTSAGHWEAAWVATGTNASAETYVLDVVDMGASIVSLAAAKAHLNKSGTRTVDDDELRGFLLAASEWVESRVGPVVHREVGPKVCRPAGGKLFLDPPVISLTTITGAHGYTGTYTVGDYYLDGETGIVESGYSATGFAYPVTVTYLAGRAVVPASIRTATLMIVKSLWDTQRGASDASPEALMQGGSDLAELPGMGLAVWRAEKLLEPYLLAPAVA